MKNNTLIIIIAVLCLGGCGYRGAVYSQYTQMGLQVKTSGETASPVDVNFGYDRGAMAIVPKRETGTWEGEAGSIIARNNMDVQLLPRTGEEVFKVDEAFISGSAAIVASLPESDRVIVTVAPRESIETKIKGSPGSRIGTALADKPKYLTEDQFILNNLLDKIKNMQNRDKIVDKAAAMFPAKINDLYEKKKKKGKTFNAFLSAKNNYLINETTGSGPKFKLLIQELNSAINKLKGEGN